MSHSSALKKVVWIAGALLVLLAVSYTLLRTQSQPKEPMVWMSSAELAQTLRPGPWTLFKWKVQRLAGPLLRHFPRHLNFVLIDSQVWSAAKGIAIPSLASPVLTNREGQKAWLLSSDELKDLQPKLSALPGMTQVSRPRIQTADGIQAGMFIGSSVLVGTNSLRAGLMFDVVPKKVGGSFRLLFGGTFTEALPVPAGSGPVVRTNFTLAGRALIPNGGALVMETGSLSPASGTNYFFLISAVAVDVRGKPLSHAKPATNAPAR